jgi:hypothetical protein
MEAELFCAQGWTGRNEEANSRSSQFWEHAWKSLKWKLTEETNMCRFCWNVDLQSNFRVTGSDSFSLVHNASAF